jgi:hypothetical protein
MQSRLHTPLALAIQPSMRHTMQALAVVMDEAWKEGQPGAALPPLHGSRPITADSSPPFPGSRPFTAEGSLSPQRGQPLLAKVHARQLVRTFAREEELRRSVSASTIGMPTNSFSVPETHRGPRAGRRVPHELDHLSTLWLQPQFGAYSRKAQMIPMRELHTSAALRRPQYYQARMGR